MSVGAKANSGLQSKKNKINLNIPDFLFALRSNNTEHPPRAQIMCFKVSELRHAFPLITLLLKKKKICT